MIAYDEDIKSTNIRGVAWLNGVGYVQFLSGRRFAYTMDKAVFEEMRSASSVGTYFSRNVKGKCPVVWDGFACDNSPCKADATMVGEVIPGDKIHLCGPCSQMPRFEKVTLAQIASGTK